MAKASKKRMGVGSRGKLSGSGAMSDISKEKLPDNMVLSNRDKSQHSEQRGLDGKEILTEQFQDHSANRLDEEDDQEIVDRGAEDAP